MIGFLKITVGGAMKLLVNAVLTSYLSKVTKEMPIAIATKLEELNRILERVSPLLCYSIRVLNLMVVKTAECPSFMTLERCKYKLSTKTVPIFDKVLRDVSK